MLSSRRRESEESAILIIKRKRFFFSLRITHRHPELSEGSTGPSFTLEQILRKLRVTMQKYLRVI